jgi:hypothetical protein
VVNAVIRQRHQQRSSNDLRFWILLLSVRIYL